MKKYILGLVILGGLVASYNAVQAASFVTTRQVDAVVEVLKGFGVDQGKIDRIVDILNEGNSGCQAGYKFSSTTGKPCTATVAPSQQKRVEPAGSCVWPCVRNAEA